MSQYRAIMSATSTLGENLIFEVTTSNINQITPGADFVVYDTWENKYKILKRKTYVPEKFNTTRYNTNFDIVIGVYGDTLRAVASDDALGYNNMVTATYGAAYSYYRIEIDTSTSGNFTCIIKPLNNVTFDISWNAGDTMDSILTQFQNIQQNQTTFAVLDDGTGIGIAVGYYGNNTCSISNVNGNVNLIDMSKFAVYDKGVKYNDDYNPDLEVINSNFKNWRGVSVQTIMGSDIIPIGPNTSCICNNGINYKYRSGINYIGWRSWASTQTEGNSFISDGVNGSTYTNELIMNKSIFDSNVNSSAVVDSDAYKMYIYYNNLLNSNGAEFQAKHDLYVSRYGEMTDLYSAYLMSHMVNTDNPTSGIVYTCKNYGSELTQAKGKIFTVTYDYKYYPAYPPEYNALQYGLDDNSRGFGKGMYYHPEPYDISVMLRDDMIEKLNNNFIEGNFKVTKLANNVYRGTCAEYNSNCTWYITAGNRCLVYDHRFYGVFRCRPVLAFAL